MACQQPGEGSGLNNPLITGDSIDKRERHRSMKWFVWPHYMVEPQYIEGYVKESQAAY